MNRTYFSIEINDIKKQYSSSIISCFKFKLEGNNGSTKVLFLMKDNDRLSLINYKINY